nr:hypothetical protein SHINE37_42878 [Rhizobiaceae bacterium]
MLSRNAMAAEWSCVGQGPVHDPTLTGVGDWLTKRAGKTAFDRAVWTGRGYPNQEWEHDTHAYPQNALPFHRPPHRGRPRAGSCRRGEGR